MKKCKMFGVGVNDADYATRRHKLINGKFVAIWTCPFYKTWKDMIKRCYMKNRNNRNRTYKDCTVCDDWLVFSNFKVWMEKQDWQGKHLDKDLLVDGNRIYSPNTCVFLHSKINYFLLCRRDATDKYMLGVCMDRQKGKLNAKCRNPITGKRSFLGYFANELDAHLAWKAKKHEMACLLADSDYCTNPIVAQALRTRYLPTDIYTVAA